MTDEQEIRAAERRGLDVLARRAQEHMARTGCTLEEALRKIAREDSVTVELKRHRESPIVESTFRLTVYDRERWERLCCHAGSWRAEFEHGAGWVEFTSLQAASNARAEIQ